MKRQQVDGIYLPFQEQQQYRPVSSIQRNQTTTMELQQMLPHFMASKDFPSIVLPRPWGEQKNCGLPLVVPQNNFNFRPTERTLSNFGLIDSNNNHYSSGRVVTEAPSLNTTNKVITTPIWTQPNEIIHQEKQTNWKRQRTVEVPQEKKQIVYETIQNDNNFQILQQPHPKQRKTYAGYNRFIIEYI
jgi:hypothetical protein